MGRFTGADEPFADQEEPDPQSWHLYSYVRNNPLRSVDSDGRTCSHAKDSQGRDVITDIDGKGCAELHDNTVHADEPGLEMLASIGDSLTNGANIAQFVSDAGRATGSVIAPQASAIAECTFPGGKCDKTNLAVAMIPGALGASGRIIKILEEAGGVIHLEVRTAHGTYEVIANITREGDKIVLEGAHIQGRPDEFGSGLIRELRVASQQFLQQEGVSELEVRPAVRTSGANPGRAMRSFTVKRD